MHCLCRCTLTASGCCMGKPAKIPSLPPTGSFMSSSSCGCDVGLSSACLASARRIVAPLEIARCRSNPYRRKGCIPILCRRWEVSVSDDNVLRLFAGKQLISCHGRWFVMQHMSLLLLLTWAGMNQPSCYHATTRLTFQTMKQAAREHWHWHLLWLCLSSNDEVHRCCRGSTRSRVPCFPASTGRCTPGIGTKPRSAKRRFPQPPTGIWLWCPPPLPPFFLNMIPRTPGKNPPNFPTSDWYKVMPPPPNPPLPHPSFLQQCQICRGKFSLRPG